MWSKCMSAQLITNYEGDEYERHEYTPYGEVWVEKASVASNIDIPYRFTGKERDEETGLYYYGARYLDAKTSRWLSTDPALGEYVPGAPINDQVRKQNQNLPGMGGVFNYVNMHLYHYAGNNPVKYLDPDGRDIIWMTDDNGGWTMGHSSILIQDEEGTWYHFNFGPGDGGGNSLAVITLNEAVLPDNITIGDKTVTNSKTEYTKVEYKTNSKVPTGLERYFDQEGDYYNYIEGDFSSSLAKAREYVATQPDYNPASLNCAWVAADVLMANYDTDSDIYNGLYSSLWETVSIFKLEIKNRRTIIPDDFNEVIGELFQ